MTVVIEELIRKADKKLIPTKTIDWILTPPKFQILFIAPA